MNPIPTILLDGIWGRPRRLRFLCRSIEERCGPTEIFRYDSSGHSCFEDLGRKLADRVLEIGRPVNIVAFSMGGLVARAARLMEPSLPLHRAVFLNSPHGGSWLAYTLSLPGIRQMRPSSDLLRRLDHVPWDIPTLAVWCPGDLIVIPGRSARWKSATRIIRCNVPLHLWPIWSRRLHRRIADFLAEREQSTRNTTAAWKGD